MLRNNELRRGVCATAILAVCLTAGAVRAQAPIEVNGLRWDDDQHVSWDPAADAEEYFLHEGPLSWAAAGVLLKCRDETTDGTTLTIEDDPLPGEGWFYVVTGRFPSGDGPAGTDSQGAERFIISSCASVQRNHVLERTGFGWSEWSNQRISVLSVAGYIQEQLDPASIDETDNVELASRRVELEPPQTIQQLQGLDLVNAVYARRQLEQRAALFWANHFNTDYRESYRFFSKYNPDLERRRLETTTFLYEELESFRYRAFNGSFRQILEDSALSRPMILYLDTDNNVLGGPNENYAREALELHTMGVDGGFTHHEIHAIARAMTGWNVCKKIPADANDPNTGCIANALIGTPEEPDGEWVANFRRTRHDCDEKTLFPGSPQEMVIPSTCATPRDGTQDVLLVLDALAAHPATARFISTKLLREFVTDTPTVAMVDAVVAVWNEDTNPHGVGDLREVLRAVLAQAESLDVDHVRAKAKTPFEHVASTIRAVRGNTNGINVVRNQLVRMQHALHENAVPTGYPESGDAWIDTNNLLERVNFGVNLVDGTGANFGADVVGLLQDNGVSTAAGNASAIVDFFIDVLFGGYLSPSARQEAIDFLNTDDDGVVSNYNNVRIRETVGLLLGYPEFYEQ